MKRNVKSIFYVIFPLFIAFGCGKPQSEEVGSIHSSDVPYSQGLWEQELWEIDAEVMGSIAESSIGRYLLKSVMYHRYETDEEYAKSFSRFKAVLSSASPYELNRANNDGSNFLVAAINLSAPSEIIVKLIESGVSREVIVDDSTLGRRMRYLDYLSVFFGNPSAEEWLLDILEAMIINDFDLTVNGIVRGHLLFMIAGGSLDLDVWNAVVEILGADKLRELINTPNARGDYIIHAAAATSHVKLLEYLVLHDLMDVRQLTKRVDDHDYLREPIEIAYLRNQRNAGRALIRLGASVEPLLAVEDSKNWLASLSE
ncbi:MAG: hypothetical protein EA401_01405 [Planctomycetota bacterium]|nr:MAG: hypothetical protein EA401_01405 [Planctomycetota bacterium]